MTDDQAALLRRLRQARRGLRAGRTLFTDDSLPPPRHATCLGVTRLHLVTGGVKRLRSCRAGEAVDVALEPGTLLYTVPHGWTLTDWRSVQETFGVVLHHGFVRYLFFEHDGTRPRRGVGPDRFFHTDHALPADGRHLVSALDEIARHHDRRPPTVGHLVEALLDILLDELACEPRGEDAAGQRLWSQVVDHLAEHATGDIDRASVARRFGLHPNSLSRLFTRHGGGETVQERLTRLRLERSRLLLRDRGLTLDQVATASGFGSANYYIKVFRRAYGQTPGGLRG